MPSFLDVEQELELLDERLTAALESLADLQREKLEDLHLLFGHEQRGERWVDRFAPLTLLYPLLHAEGLPRVGIGLAREVCCSHFLLVLHAFLDDRVRDGQIVQELRDREIAWWLVDKALRDLDQVLSCRPLALSLLGDYRAAQDAKATSIQELEGLVVRRHLIGFVATRCLVAADRADPIAVTRVEELFQHTALALQWFDDFKDVEEDLSRGAPNLLLSSLHGELETEAARILEKLQTRRILDEALEQTKRHLALARELANELGFLTLGRLLTSRHEWISTIQVDFLDTRNWPPLSLTRSCSAPS